jgi:anti-sigma B factor antagonist
MEITWHTIDSLSIIVILGRIDFAAAKNVEKMLNNVIDQDQTKIVVDLAGVDYISAVGLRVLLAALKKQRQKQGELKLAALQPFVKEVFEVTGFTKLFPIHANRDEAIRSMSP